MENHSSEKIAEALKLLEEAAREKTDELRAAMSDKYTHLRSFVIDSESNLRKAATSARDHVTEAAEHARKAGIDRTRDIAHDVDRSVHQNPWPYIVASSAIGTLVGYILGRDRK